MKKILTLLCLSILLLAIGTTAQSQFMCSVRPQILGLDGAAFGYKFPGDVAVYGGIDYLHFGATIETSSSFTLSPDPFHVSSSSSNKYESSMSLYNLFVGAKCFIVKSGSAKGYLLGEVSRPIVKLSTTSNGKDDPNVQQLSDNLSIWGVKAGFGCEYFFADEFSLGGEFGLRYFFISTKTEQSNTQSLGGTPPTTYTSQTSTDLTVDIGLTYTMLTLNYYFGK